MSLEISRKEEDVVIADFLRDLLNAPGAFPELLLSQPDPLVL